MALNHAPNSPEVQAVMRDVARVLGRPFVLHVVETGPAGDALEIGLGGASRSQLEMMARALLEFVQGQAGVNATACLCCALTHARIAKALDALRADDLAPDQGPGSGDEPPPNLEPPRSAH